MPQFDFFAWASVCFWTILSFQLFYVLILYFFIVPVVELSKYVQKLSILYSVQVKTIIIKDYFLLVFFNKKKEH